MVTNVTDKYLKMKIHIRHLWHLYGCACTNFVEKGHTVSGSDKQFYPPMSDQLDSLGVEMIKGLKNPLYSRRSLCHWECIKQRQSVC